MWAVHTRHVYARRRIAGSLAFAFLSFIHVLGRLHGVIMTQSFGCCWWLNYALRDFISNINVTHDINQLNFIYLTETEFNSKYASKIESGSISLSAFHVNIGSLNSSHSKLCQFLQLLCINFDIIVLTEIWNSHISFYCNILPT